MNFVDYETPGWLKTSNALSKMTSTENLYTGKLPRIVLERFTRRAPEKSVECDGNFGVSAAPGMLLYFFKNSKSISKRHAILVINPDECLAFEVSTNAAHSQNGDASRYLTIPHCRNRVFCSYPGAHAKYAFDGGIYLNHFEWEWEKTGYALP